MFDRKRPVTGILGVLIVVFVSAFALGQSQSHGSSGHQSTQQPSQNQPTVPAAPTPGQATTAQTPAAGTHQSHGTGTEGSMSCCKDGKSSECPMHGGGANAQGHGSGQGAGTTGGHGKMGGGMGGGMMGSQGKMGGGMGGGMMNGQGKMGGGMGGGMMNGQGKMGGQGRATSSGGGAGHGQGAGHGAPAEPKDPEMAAHRDTVHALLDGHKKIRRSVEVLPNGIRSTTESDDPAVAALLKKHVPQMYKFLEADKAVRHWDPLFQEIFKNSDKIKMTVEQTDKGVRVVETSEDPRVAALIQEHSKVIDNFVATGWDSAHKENPVPAAAKK